MLVERFARAVCDGGRRRTPSSSSRTRRRQQAGSATGSVRARRARPSRSRTRARRRVDLDRPRVLPPGCFRSASIRSRCSTRASRHVLDESQAACSARRFEAAARRLPHNDPERLRASSSTTAADAHRRVRGALHQQGRERRPCASCESQEHQQHRRRVWRTTPERARRHRDGPRRDSVAPVNNDTRPEPSIWASLRCAGERAGSRGGPAHHASRRARTRFRGAVTATALQALAHRFPQPLARRARSTSQQGSDFEDLQGLRARDLLRDDAASGGAYASGSWSTSSTRCRIKHFFVSDELWETGFLTRSVQCSSKHRDKGPRRSTTAADSLHLGRSSPSSDQPPFGTRLRRQVPGAPQTSRIRSSQDQPLATCQPTSLERAGSTARRGRLAPPIREGARQLRHPRAAVSSSSRPGTKRKCCEEEVPFAQCPDVPRRHSYFAGHSTCSPTFSAPQPLRRRASRARVAVRADSKRRAPRPCGRAAPR